ncbi:MAG: hypothetical protein ND895_16965 [Pyrinomonadaceae bacterium]|nr:hypothetical protein [Pyrinomonadaceae bacterium]
MRNIAGPNMTNIFENDPLPPPATAPMPAVCGPLAVIPFQTRLKIADISG